MTIGIVIPPDAKNRPRIFFDAGAGLRGWGSSRRGWPAGGTELLIFWVPGAPASPNRRGRTTRARMSRTTTERTDAQAKAIAARNATKWGDQGTRPARVTFCVYRRRLLDPLVNLPASIKATQDGVCKAVLPLGDGPGTPYRWLPVEQVQVKTKAEEGVLVAIERPQRSATVAAPRPSVASA